MDHVAVLRKARISKGDNLLRDILEGTKTIESRWYVNKISPWDNIKIGDTVYFKESGCYVSAKAIVANVLQYENLSAPIIESIVSKYGSRISPHTTLVQWKDWISTLTNKKYCILVFLENIEKITPFDINKSGFGISAAWLAVGDIENVKEKV